MIPEETIEQIRQASDIVQVVGEYLRLKKRGRNFVGLCPFHTEKTPSFSVSPEKQIFYCFGCGKGGNVFSFLMEHEKMSFVEAVRLLARQANITIREEAGSDFRRQAMERLGYANQVALEYFQKTLGRSKYGAVLQKYLKGKRRITDSAIEHFALGLAAEDWDGLIRYAAGRDLTAEDLVKAGLALLSEKRGNYFDRFRQRLMIPIYNLSGKPIAFGGRTLKKGEPAKYINSPETPLYVKGNVLYGLSHARDFIRETGAAIIVEGYFDVISLWQVGVKNVVASSGTSFTAQQARLLARFATDAYLFFDADSAGQNAALRSVDALYDAGLEVRVILTLKGEDPDTIALKYGSDKIDELMHEAIGFIPFRVRNTDVASAGIVGKEKLVKELASLGARIADPTRRSLFYAEAADVLGVDVQILHGGAPQVKAADEPATARGPKYDPCEFELVSLLFNGPGSIDTVFDTVAPDDFSSKELSRLYAAMVNQYRKLGAVDAGRMLDGVQDQDFASLLSEIVSTDWPADRVDVETARMLEQMRQRKQAGIRARLKEELIAATEAGDEERASRIQREIQGYGLDADKSQN